MLIVRDLAPGPRRFTDLFEGLAGISTDLLTSRLRTLETAGAVERRRVSAPVPGNVYELTQRGRELEKICHDLARWGMPLLPVFAETPLQVNARWALQTMAANASGLPDPAIVHFVVDGDEMTLDIDPEGARISYGLNGDPVATVRSSSAGFFTLRSRLLAGHMTTPDGVEVIGDLDELRAIVETLPLLPSPA